MARLYIERSVRFREKERDRERDMKESGLWLTPHFSSIPLSLSFSLFLSFSLSLTMGGETKLITECLQPEVPTAFTPLSSFKHTTDEVVIIDMHQRRFGINLRGSTILTGEQCCEFFINMILRYQTFDKDKPTQGNIHSLLLLFDKPRFVPKEKKRVQAVRGVSRAKSNQLSYGDGCMLTLGGVKIPDAEGDLTSDDPSNPTRYRLERINTERLAITGYLFRQFALMLEQQLIAHHTTKPFLSQIVMDYDRYDDKAPLMLTPTALDLIIAQRPGTRDPLHSLVGNYLGGTQLHWINNPLYKNEIGEVDLLVNFYLSKFPQQRAVLYSKDFDHLPLLLQYLDAEELPMWPRQLYWIRHEKNPSPPSKRKAPTGPRESQPSLKSTPEDEFFASEPITTLYVIDMLEVYNAIVQGTPSLNTINIDLNHIDATSQRIQAFVLACILNDTDYYQKKFLSHQFGWRDIVAGVCQAWPELRSLLRSFDDITAASLTQQQRIRLLTSFVRCQFDQKPNLFKNGKPSVSVKASGTLDWYKVELSTQKKFRVPSDEELTEGLKQIQFNWLYWKHNNNNTSVLD